ncbi:MAG TPA: hypothetical protein PKE16_12130, partial [Hyphomicrobium sp.]|nr:hypothetical protein [Hyphomicrobium sp.]
AWRKCLACEMAAIYGGSGGGASLAPRRMACIDIEVLPELNQSKKTGRTTSAVAEAVVVR